MNLPHSKVLRNSSAAIIIQITQNSIGKRAAHFLIQSFQIRNFVPAQKFPSGQINACQIQMKPQQCSNHNPKKSQNQSQTNIKPVANNPP